MTTENRGSAAGKKTQSMATLNIPDEALPDLTRIVELDQGFFDSFLASVKETAPTLTRGQFVNKIVATLPAASKSDLAAILRATVALYQFKEKSDLSSEELADAVVESPLISTSEKFSDEAKRILRTRLSGLFDLDKSLGVTSKAVDVMTEHERTFCNARILSDIRPVFVQDLEDAAGAVIVHNLQIGFHQYGKHQEFYFALDSDDLQSLKKIIDRAEKKELALERMLRKSETPYLKVSE